MVASDLIDSGSDMEANVAFPAALIGDPTRAAILMALLDGRFQPASALAYAANVTPQSASNHLARLLDGGLLAVERQGRHRYYRLASPDIAAALEALAVIAPSPRHLCEPLTQKGRTLRFARCCYDHLAGQLGVAVTDALLRRGILRVDASRARYYEISTSGHAWFVALGIDPAARRAGKPLHARCCLDWTERRYHLAGSLGTVLLERFETLGWLQRQRETRAVQVTPDGCDGLLALLGIDCQSLNQAMRARADTLPLPAAATAA